MSRHFEKLAEAFSKAGIGEADLPTSATSYMDDVGGHCQLCGTAIKHRYLLAFHRQPPVEFFPVGSKCILIWFKAMPESLARSAAMARVRVAERDMRKQQKLLSLLEESGDEDGARLMRVWFRLPSEVQEAEGPLADIAAKVTRYKKFASDKQRNFFGGLVRSAARANGVDDLSAPGAGSGRQPAQEPQEGPDLTWATDTERALLDCYLALPDDLVSSTMVDMGRRAIRGQGFASDKQREFFAKLVQGAGLLKRFRALTEADLAEDRALADMGVKLEQYGSFASDKQRGYFTSLLQRAEAGTSAPSAAEESAAAAVEGSTYVAPPLPPATSPVPQPVALLPEDEDDDWDGDPF